MPLLHRKLFVPKTPPEVPGNDHEVFYCPLTKEAFTDYEEFFDRTILCNSLVWSCSITERGNMTYQEALDCEEEARKKFDKFPEGLQKPMLLLVNLIARSRIEILNDTIFSFIKKRYFVGETLDVKVKTNKFEMCRILDVIPIKKSSDSAEAGMSNGHTNGELSTDEDDDDKPLAKFIKARPLEPFELKYQVKLSSASMHPIRVVPWTALRRKIRREQCKIFLKMMCFQNMENGRVYMVKGDIAEKFGIKELNWEDVFAGPPPVFGGQSPKVKKMTEKVEEKKTADKKATEKTKLEILKAKQEKLKEELLLQEMKKQEKENRLEMKRKEMEEARRLKQIANEQRKREYRDKIEKMREVKRKLAEYKKQWNKQRDDLECEDLKELPLPHKIVTQIPHHLLGDVLSLLEFFHTFESLFDAKDEFPKGVSVSLLEKALMKEDQDGPLCDFLFFFLSNLFRTRTEEEGETLYTLEAEDKELAAKVKEDPSMDNLVAAATVIATWPINYQGCSINDLELDSYTVSEILRLYLLTTAARPPSDSRLWRFQQRGGYCVADDTALRFCLNRPELVEKLSNTSIFNFTPDEKLEILMCLSNQLISYVTPRDFLDELSEKYFAALQDYREDRRSEKKREKDSMLDRLKWKNAQEIQNREMKLKQMMTKLDENNPNEGNISKVNKHPQKLDEESEEQPKLMSLKEQMEHLRMLDEDEQVAKEAWEFRQTKHLNDIAQHQKFKVLCLGEDRFFRRYWTLNCISGILVEEYEDEYLTKDLLRVKVPQRDTAHQSFTPTQVQNNSTATDVSMSKNSENATDTQNNSNGPVPDHVVAHINLESSLLTNPVTNTTINSSTSTSVLTSTDTSTSNNPSKELSDAGTQGHNYRWYIYTEKEKIEQLLASLNKRGFRESKLHDAINRIKDKIFSNLDKCPINELCKSSKNSDVNIESEFAKTAIELSLRDQLLDLESRIFEGTLGGIKEEDGFQWVERVTHRGTYNEELRNSLINTVDTIYDKHKIKIEHEEGQQQNSNNKNEVICCPHVEFSIKAGIKKDDSVIEYENDDEQMQVSDDRTKHQSHRGKIQDLSLALLQIERGIDRKYLKPPLGYSVDISRRKTRSKGPAEDSEKELDEKKKESIEMLKRWESSLISSTSISQISLHLATLNKCIIWARSVLNASCRICHRRGNADKMLLCDSCDRGHHMYCLKPALKNVPSGDWFCPQCKPIHSNRLTPRKVRTTSYSQQVSSEEEEDTEAEETEEEDDDDEENEEENEEEEEQEESSQDEEDMDEPSPLKQGIKCKFPSKNSKVTSRGKKSKNTSPVTNSSKSRGRSFGRGSENSKTSADISRRGRSASERRKAMKRNASNEDDGDLGSSNRRRSTGVWKDLNTCQELLKELIQHKDSWPFLMPVSKKQVPDYYDIIPNPMDFSTMQNKLKSVKYQSPAEFIVDVKLVFTNCLTYNMPRSVHAKAAVQLGNFFEKKLRETGLDQYKKEIQENPPNKRRKS
uniref:bromodomain adjacent to zinc finger domain protein 1A-like isoform X1 n=1 Tax=Styela clava TaxID=7725 RepID=UPI00193978EA|nr:bromodomain adjacent to zinc finger domain protein 1A-like isoform X1 [Styela clava]